MYASDVYFRRVSSQSISSWFQHCCVDCVHLHWAACLWGKGCCTALRCSARLQSEVACPQQGSAPQGSSASDEAPRSHFPTRHHRLHPQEQAQQRAAQGCELASSPPNRTLETQQQQHIVRPPGNLELESTHRWMKCGLPIGGLHRSQLRADVWTLREAPRRTSHQTC